MCEVIFVNKMQSQKNTGVDSARTLLSFSTFKAASYAELFIPRARSCTAAKQRADASDRGINNSAEDAIFSGERQKKARANPGFSNLTFRDELVYVFVVSIDNVIFVIARICCATRWATATSSATVTAACATSSAFIFFVKG